MYTCGCENLSVSIKSLTSSTEEESRDPLEDVEEPEWQEARIVCLQHEYTSLKITEVAQQSRTKVECVSNLFWIYSVLAPQISEHKSFMTPRRTCYFFT